MKRIHHLNRLFLACLFGALTIACPRPCMGWPHNNISNIFDLHPEKRLTWFAGESNIFSICNESASHEVALRVCTQAGAQGGHLQDWITRTIDGKTYYWKVRTVEAPNEVPIGDGPLSDYVGTILGIAAFNDFGEQVTDPYEVLSAFYAVENALHIAENPFSGDTESIPYSQIYNMGEQRVDDTNAVYHIPRSTLTASTGAIGTYLEFQGASGFSDYSIRRRLWKDLSMNVALQPSLFAHVGAGDAGAEAYKSELYAYAEQVCRSAGGVEQSKKIIGMLKYFSKTAPNLYNVDTTVTEVFQLASDTLDNGESGLVLHVDLVKHVTRRKIFSLKESFGDLADAMTLAGFAAHYTGEVSEALMLQAIARAQGEERLQALKDLADDGAFADTAAIHGIADALAAYEEVKTSFVESVLTHH